MKSYTVKAGCLQKHCTLPSSKSQSIRALLFASLAKGQSRIENTLPSPDIQAMIRACQQLGAEITQNNNTLSITGVAGKITTPNDVIDAGNSGQVLRFIACLAGLQSNHMVITGDASIRSNRPVQPLIDALPKLGVACASLQNNGHAPLILTGPFQGDHTSLTGEDSQPVSGLIMAALFKKGDTTIEVKNPGETPWIDLTLAWLDRFQVTYHNDHYRRYRISGNHTLDGFHYSVPGDLSSLSFPLVAALITQSDIVIHGVDLREPQGDKAVIATLQAMGADLRMDSATHTLSVHKGTQLQGGTIDINHYIDCIAILAVAACFAAQPTHIKGAAIARKKESDRIAAIACELKKMGADIEEQADGLIIKPSRLRGAAVYSHHDHRIAMALAVAGLASEGTTTVQDVACVQKSYPNFLETMQSMGAPIEGS